MSNSQNMSIGTPLHYTVIAGLVLGMVGLILSASFQAWSLALFFVVGLLSLAYIRTKYDEVIFREQ